jgi:uncharacterized membrane protein YfcA
MPTAKAALFLLLGVFVVGFLAVWLRSLTGPRTADLGRIERGRPRGPHYFIGFVATFFDTLGIGSFATTTSYYKLCRLVRDELIPGTLNVGITLPTAVQALIYVTIVEVDMGTLVLMIAASVAGAWLGAGIVAGWPRLKIQVGMGVALLVAASLMMVTMLDRLPPGGETISLSGARLFIGLAGNFMLGALMTLGIGLYAPCMILVSLLGMNPTTAFPIMMGSCAFLMPVASVRFIRKGSYSLPGAIGLVVGGIPAVLLAAFIVKSLPLEAVRWLVVCVVVYTGVTMLRSAGRERRVPLATDTIPA